MTTGMTLLLMGALHARGEAIALDLEAWLSKSITNLTYQPPAPAEFTRAKELFGQTLRGDKTAAELRTGWENLGFGFYEVAAGGAPLWLVSEPAGKEFGRGWYLFRTIRESTIALEAPHAKNDIHTGIITLRLFLAGQARALAASTITRHRADMAHLGNTYFQAFTLAFADTCPTGLVVQIHGFESENHDAKADVIASAGTRSPETWLGKFVQQLKNATSAGVLAYPQDIKQLGGTSNSQGEALRKTAHCRFLHLEISKELRDRLTRDPKMRLAILNSLSTAQKP